MTDLTYEVDGATLFGWQEGTGPVVLLLHAGGEQSRVWRPVASLLCQALDVRCVAVDQRGHGRSTGRAERINDFGDDAAAIIQTFDQPCVVVGASLGGFAAIDALRSVGVRERIAGLVLVDVVPAPDPARVRLFLDRQGMAESHRLLTDDILAAGERLSHLLHDADMPTVLVHSRRSAITDAEVARLRLLVLDLDVIPVDAGHLVAREAPTELATTIAQAAERWLIPKVADR